MSKILGTIHYLMYEKIKYQDEITKYLLEGREEFEKLNEIMPPVSTDSLEKLVDPQNIHGWLSARIDIVESRFAYAINTVADAEEKIYEFGIKESLNKKFNSAKELYGEINKRLLDGMPCDRALLVSEDEDGNLYLEQKINLHKEYEESPLFKEPSLSLIKNCNKNDPKHNEKFEIEDFETLKKDEPYDASLFYICRFQFLKGFLKDSGYLVKMINDTDFKLEKITN
ncbi:MAG: hypothetical protein Q4P29_06030 [Tissierellia bacterium]|nr:hypothetical protein [Tissierellia bacterium]